MSREVYNSMRCCVQQCSVLEYYVAKRSEAKRHVGIVVDSKILS